MSLLSRSRISDISTIKELSMWSSVHNMRHINTHTHTHAAPEIQNHWGRLWVFPISGKEAPETAVITQEQNEQLRNELVEKTALSMMLCTHIPANQPMTIEALSLNNGLELEQTLEDILTKPSDTLHTVGSYADHQEQGTNSPPSSPTADNDTAQAVPGLPPGLKCSLLVFLFFFCTGVLSSPHSVFCYFRFCFFMSPKTWKLLHSQLCSFPLSFFFFRLLRFCWLLSNLFKKK